MSAEIFSVGTELLLGQILDTNAAYLAQQLSRLGIDCYYKTTVGDNRERLVAAFRASFQRSQLILATGGLGPTEDDLTAAAVAEACNIGLELHKPSADAIQKLLAERNIPLLDSHLKQAWVPHGSQVLPNPVGTAPGFAIEKNGNFILALPGPPHEMKPMFEQYAAPYLQERFGGQIIHSRVLRFMGIGESLLEENLKDLIELQDNPTIAPLAGQGEVRIRLTAKASDVPTAQALIAPIEAEIRNRVGNFLFGADDEAIEEIVGRLLKERKLTLAVAESCTGGLIAHRLTNITGSSDYLLAGLVAYSNEAKTSLLGVSETTLQAYGAVSEETARTMAHGVKKAIGADIGLAVTGIAGPTGATETKPIGLVYIAISNNSGNCCEAFRFRGDRETIKQFAASAALNLLRKTLTIESRLTG